jgi:hypothetical protein
VGKPHDTFGPLDVEREVTLFLALAALMGHVGY